MRRDILWRGGDSLSLIAGAQLSDGEDPGKGRRMTSIQSTFERASNPVDIIESIATVHDWAFERSTEDELTLSVAGTWCDYHISLNWRDDLEALHMACAFDLKVPQPRLNEIYKLIALINEQLWLGHFDLWRSEGLLLFRHGLMLNGAEPTPNQCEALLHAALEACERNYQSFQFVIWAGKSADDSLAMTMFETEGQA
jgi:hypothetical protein